MSKVAIAGNASGTGTFTIAAPNSNTDRTLTLPDTAGTIALQNGVGVGKVLQVVSTAIPNGFTTSSTSYVDVTGASLSITPSSASSKILVLAAYNHGPRATGGNTGAVSWTKWFRNSTEIGTELVAHWGVSNNEMQTVASFAYLDSPATTSAVTYKMQGRVDQSYQILYINYLTTGNLILMEIAA